MQFFYLVPAKPSPDEKQNMPPRLRSISLHRLSPLAPNSAPTLGVPLGAIFGRVANGRGLERRHARLTSPSQGGRRVAQLTIHGHRRPDRKKSELVLSQGGDRTL